MNGKLIEIAAEIVKAQLALTPMSANEIVVSLRMVYQTLLEMRDSPGVEEGLFQIPEQEERQDEPPALLPADSIQDDRVICLECGAEMKQLTRKHLESHGLSPREYREKHGFSMRTPLAAKSLTLTRSKIAKERGLPENLRKFLENKRQSVLESVPQPLFPDEGANKEGGRQTILRKKRLNS